MRSSTILVWLGVGLVASGASGCGSSHSDGTDAGSGGAHDAGFDARVTAQDASGAFDAGAQTDSGGATSDAGPGADAGAREDAGSCAGGCGPGRTCCDDLCVSTFNDPHNCGGCGMPCSDSQYCTGASCQPKPCTVACGDSGPCCGDRCCLPGQICCDPGGPISMGPTCQDPNAAGTCPTGCAPLCVCASPDTLIATPSGERAIATLQVGDLVYSVEHGAVVVVPVAYAGRTAAVNHHVVRVELENGTTLEISPGHPTADGRTFGELRAGDSLDGIAIDTAELVPYMHAFTYDILPASESGTYYAGGALIGSTLKGQELSRE